MDSSWLDRPELEFVPVLAEELVDGPSLREDDDGQTQLRQRDPHQHVGRQRHAARTAAEYQSAATHEGSDHQDATDR
jgi:hypothetical protein